MSLLAELLELRGRRARPHTPPAPPPTMPAHPREHRPAAVEAAGMAPDPVALARAHQPRTLGEVGRQAVAKALGRDRPARAPGEPVGPRQAAEENSLPSELSAAGGPAGGQETAPRGLAPPGEASRSFAGFGGGGYGGDPVLSAMANEYYSEMDLLGLPAVECAINLISSTVASLPAVVMTPDDNGILQPLPSHPVTRLLAYPGPYINSYELMERLVADVATGGNGTAVITRDLRGVPAELRYLPPGAAFPERSPRSMLVFYRVSDPDQNTSYILQDEDVLHIRYRLDPRDRLHGISPVRLGGRTLRLAATSERYAESFMRNRGVPGAVITTEKTLNDKAKNNLRSQIAAFFGGSNVGRAMVLEQGSTFVLAGHSLKDAQLVEASELLVSATARLFSVPPALLGQTEGLNYSAMREVISAWTRLGLRGWLTRVEQALTDKLLSEDMKARGGVVRFQVEGLTRLDDLDRARFYGSMVGGGVLTSNEARRREGLSPLPGGDELRRLPGEQGPNNGRPPGARDVSSGDPTPGPVPEE